ncbi:Vacuolar protein sorting-associated protein VTA1-like protein [Hypsibius exemplaris]|uniref:Vacuolar protein sorting-associated protein VTA1-like protein n=1 Tax=Hypsibius exemplaris TaxID=2072580 RepID=A0A9X6RJW7_HYPEX|nr:Vacuolar protein sorting-associated protein VTA1-like protein [Hypsibius exemplaris]
MASLKNLPPCPDNLKPMLHFLKAAVEHDNRDPVVAYWLRYHAVKVGIRIDSKSPPAKTFINGVMTALETTKKNLKTNEAVTTDIVAQAHVENYALKLFGWADAEDRASHFNRDVIKAFYTVGLLFDVLTIWGELTDDIKEQQKYAKWKAAYLHNCLKNGETPVPGPVGGFTDEDNDLLALTIGQNQNPPAAGGAIPPANVASSYIPPASQDDIGSNSLVYDDQPFVPKLPTKPHTHTNYPVAPPRGGSSNPPPITSPSWEAHHDVGLTSVTGVKLSSNDLANAQKYCKYAASALQFDDLQTATDLLEKTLRLLKTGREN